MCSERKANLKVCLHCCSNTKATTSNKTRLQQTQPSKHSSYIYAYKFSFHHLLMLAVAMGTRLAD